MKMTRPTLKTLAVIGALGGLALIPASGQGPAGRGLASV